MAIIKEKEDNKYTVAGELARDRSSLSHILLRPTNYSMFEGRKNAIVLEAQQQLRVLDDLIKEIIS